MKGNARGRKRLAGVNFANVATRCHFSKSLPNGRPFISFIRASETALTLRLPVSSVSFYLGIGCCCVVSSLSPPLFFCLEICCWLVCWFFFLRLSRWCYQNRVTEMAEMGKKWGEEIPTRSPEGGGHLWPRRRESDGAISTNLGESR